jgi:hypothetical protein
MPDDPTPATSRGTLVPASPADEHPSALIAVPPGSDIPRGGSLKLVGRPAWRPIAIATSIAVIAALVLFVVLPTPHDSAVKVVDPTSVIAKAMKQAPEIVHLPDPLPAGWRVDSAHFEVTAPGAHLHIGYAGPDNGINGLEETNVTSKHTDIKIFVAQNTADGTLVDLVSINGVIWNHDASSRLAAEQSLIFYGRTTTIVVTGTSSLADLTQLAASLHITG